MKIRLIINTLTDWREPPRARHQFTIAIAKKMPVVFIARNKWGMMRLAISKPEENITLIEPFFPVHCKLRHRLPLINELYQAWLYSKIYRAYGNLTLVNFDFTATILPYFFQKIIYYCNDEFISMSKYNFVLFDQYFAWCEKRVALKAKVCITTSNYLTNKLKKINPNTYEIPLGAAISSGQDVKFAARKSKDKIIVGQVGFLTERCIPVALMNRIIDCDKFQLVLIGPIEKSLLRKLNKHDNLRIVDSLQGQALYSELNRFDVGLALYNLEKINRGTTSNKLWQYLSLGMPVVVSNLPNLKETIFPPKSVYTLTNEDKIVVTIIQAFNENSHDIMQARLEFARKNSWNIRVDKFLEIISQYF